MHPETLWKMLQHLQQELNNFQIDLQQKNIEPGSDFFVLKTKLNNLLEHTDVLALVNTEEKSPIID
jgi:hypothetical protein